MKIQQLHEVDGRRTFAPVCDRGNDPVEALTAAAKRFDLSAASLTGIGAFSGVTLGFFDRGRRDYARRVIRGRVESPATLRRKTDPATGLALLDIDWSGSP